MINEKIENKFKHELHLKRKLVGSWNMMASPIATEAMGWIGFDFLTIDMEHAPYTIPKMIDCLRAISCTPTAPIIRLPSHDPVVVKQVLDSGVQTLMFPMVETRQDAINIVNSTRYQPEGNRGFAFMQRASHYGTVTDYAQKINREICIIAQLETKKAIDNLEEIAEVSDIDALFVGPGDLSANMGCIGNPADPSVQALLENVLKRCIQANIPAGTVFSSPEKVRQLLSDGYQFVAVSSDLGIMMQGAKRTLNEICCNE